MKPTAMLLAIAALAGCASDPGAQLVFNLDADLTQPKAFFDAPWPSDLRRDAAGHPVVDGWPTRGSLLLEGLRDLAKERVGFPVLPVAYFQFTKPIAARSLDTLIPAAPSSPILLVDIDAASPERGRLLPTVARTMVSDDYMPPNVLAVAPRPGFVLAPRRSYAFVVLRAANDAAGRPLGVVAALGDLASGHAPSGGHGAAAKAAYDPLFATLTALGIDA